MAQVVVVQIYERTGHRLFPIANLSDVDPGTGIHFWIDRAHHLALPILVLMVAGIAGYSRYMRAVDARGRSTPTTCAPRAPRASTSAA